jgi:hypothetical protein
MVVKHFSFGVLPSMVHQTLYGNEGEYLDPISLASFLEFWHMEIFFIMMILLTLSAVYGRLCENTYTDLIVMNITFMSSIISLIALGLAFYVEELFVSLYSFGFLIWHLFAIYMVLNSLWKLHRA